MTVALIIAVGIGFLLISTGSALAVIGGIFLAAAYITTVIAQIMIPIKRAHDRDHTGWYILLTMIPLIGIIWSIELAFFSGTAGSNGYGADPRT